MSTVMCQALQSSLDPLVKDTDILLLKLTAPKSIEKQSIFPQNITTSHIIPNLDLSGWSFLQSLSNNSQPKVSKSLPSPRLNEKSLELCTENLGNETGSDTSESSINLESRTEKPSREHQKIIKQVYSGKKANSRSFPPPLTTIRNSNSYLVRPHREDGRLIIKVVEAPYIGTCFEAHRAHGRLQLRFSKNCMQSTVENQEDTSAENLEDEESVVNIMNKGTWCKESGNCITEDGLCHREPFWVAT